MPSIAATNISEAGNIVFTILFGIVCLTHTFFGVYFKRRKFLVLIFLGTSLSTIGYAGRVWYRQSLDINAYVLQTICVAIAPGFVFGAIRELLIHYVSFLRIQSIELERDWYQDKGLEYFFIYEYINRVANIVSVALIGAGIGTFYNDTSESSLKSSISATLAGFCIQLALALFTIIIWFYFLFFGIGKIRLTNKIKFYLSSLLFELICITIRITFRVAEWGKIYDYGVLNNLTLDENYLLILDGMTTLLACISLLIFHPGFVFGMANLENIDNELKRYKRQRRQRRSPSKEKSKWKYIPIIRFFVK